MRFLWVVRQMSVLERERDQEVDGEGREKELMLVRVVNRSV